MASLPVLAEVRRGELVESAHHGSALALDQSGQVALAAGTPEAPMYPRSSAKPLQATAMLQAGLSLDGELLALAAGSHGGLPFHLDGVRRILGGAGVTESDLDCTPDLPLDETAMRAHLAAGGGPSRLCMNCSGKHAAMLATCVAAGWPTAGYRSPEHPLQRAVAATIAALAAEPVAVTTVDGCGAPLYAVSLHGLARAFLALMNAEAHTPAGRVAHACAEHPAWVSGPGRGDTVMMQGLPGALVKGGAEGVLALAIPSGPALAVKIADGAGRATAPVAIAMLDALGIDTAELAELATPPVLGHGEPVGSVRAVPFAGGG
jgi:L-asparaginase II